MKTTIAVFVTSTLLFTGTLFTGCNSPEEKVSDAKMEVSEAQDDLTEAKEDYKAEIDNYRMEMAAKADMNQKSIDNLIANLDKQRKESKAEYKAKIEELKEKNEQIKKRMAEYKEEGKDNWEKFKTEFNHDVKDLGDAIENLGKDNVD